MGREPMKILVTAGPVYGKLDDNKLVSNRVRGLWAAHFARYLESRGHTVTFLCADTMTVGAPVSESGGINVIRHSGYAEYAAICEEHAHTHDAAVLAAAVVNWIPANPIKGKMATEGYKEGDIINVPFVLAPRVINQMRHINPKMTLVGCKMLSGSTEEKLIDAAEHVIEASKAHVVVANDLSDLKHKRLVYPDGAVFHYDRDFNRMFADLVAVIEDKHYTTLRLVPRIDPRRDEARAIFSLIADKYRSRFTPRGDGKVFGAIAVRTEGGWLVSPRTKRADFTGADAVFVESVDHDSRVVWVDSTQKASMNTPLLLRSGERFTPARPAVLHLHEMLPNAPILPYAPPGTVRDTMRELRGSAINIEGHGFITVLDPAYEIPAAYRA